MRDYVVKENKKEKMQMFLLVIFILQNHLFLANVDSNFNE